MNIGNSNNYKIFSNYPEVVSNNLIAKQVEEARCWGKRGDVPHDIYNHQRAIELLVQNVNNWAKPEDVQLFLRFYEDLILQDASRSRQHIYLTRLKLLSRLVPKPISQLEYDDIRKLVFNLKQACTSPATIVLYLETIRKFFLLTLKVPKEKLPIHDIRIHVPKHYTKLLLDEDDIMRLTNIAQNYRDKAYIQLQWETGGRVGEMMNCTVQDVDFTNHLIRLDGKTGERTVPVLSSLPFLKMHITSRAMEPDQYLWSEINGTTLHYDALRIQLSKIAKRAGINKPVNPHNFRHSRATYCAQFMNEPLLKKYFGWSPQSTVPARYIHLSGKDLQNSVLINNGFAPPKPIISKLAPKQCHCGELNSYEEIKCIKCKNKLLIAPKI